MVSSQVIQVMQKARSMILNQDIKCFNKNRGWILVKLLSVVHEI